MINDEIITKCYVPDNQFGLNKADGCNYSHYLIVNLLVNAVENGELLYLAGLNVSKSFDSGIHAHILLNAYKSGVNSPVVKAFRDM